MYDNLTDIIDISSLPMSLFSTLVNLSTSPIEFHFTTSIRDVDKFIGVLNRLTSSEAISMMYVRPSYM